MLICFFAVACASCVCLTGIDAGGLRKEFFQLIIAELFDPRFGMFLLNEETRTLRFNPDSMESTFEFEVSPHCEVLYGLD